MEVIKAKAATAIWELEQGVDFDDPLTYTDANGAAIDLTNYTARMKIKNSITDTASIDELTTENSRIVLGGQSGTITCKWTAQQTAAYTFDQAVYDLELIDASNKVYRILKGKMVLIKEVTK